MKVHTSISSRRGFLLVEIVALLWGLAVLMLVGTAVLVAAFQIQKASGTAFNRLTARSVLADQFREDVNQATATPEAMDNVKASPTCLILRQPGDKHLIYRWENNHLERVESSAKGKAPQRMSMGPDCLAVEFIRPAGDKGVITLRMTEPRGFRKLTRQMEISAALGGDRR